MGSYSWVKERVNALHKVNFQNLIKYKYLNPDNVYQNAFRKDSDNPESRYIVEKNGYCNLCDRDTSYEPADGVRSPGYRLTNISHGTHTIDFLRAFGLSDSEIEARIGGNAWIDDPVLFLMENPSTGSDIYDFVEGETDGKRPANCWYWIHGDWQESYKKGYFEDSSYLVQSQYGSMVASLIYQFKLGNAYLTNVVKCGLTDARLEGNEFRETGYKNLEDYSRECKCNCIKTILSNEIRALCEDRGQLRPVRIFAFGERPYWIIQDYLNSKDNCLRLKYQVYQLPHPASREKNMYRKHILRGIIQEAFISDGFKETGERGISIKAEKVRQVFNEVYKNTGLPIGVKATKNQLALKMNSYRSLFSEDEIVSEIWLIGNAQDQFRWGIGYVFETNSYWYWNYDENKEVEDISLIPHVGLFKKAISEILGK